MSTTSHARLLRVLGLALATGCIGESTETSFAGQELLEVVYDGIRPPTVDPPPVLEPPTRDPITGLLPDLYQQRLSGASLGGRRLHSIEFELDASVTAVPNLEVEVGLTHWAPAEQREAIEGGCYVMPALQSDSKRVRVTDGAGNIVGPACRQDAVTRHVECVADWGSRDAALSGTWIPDWLGLDDYYLLMLQGRYDPSLPGARPHCGEFPLLSSLDMGPDGSLSFRSGLKRAPSGEYCAMDSTIVPTDGRRRMAARVSLVVEPDPNACSPERRDLGDRALGALRELADAVGATLEVAATCRAGDLDQVFLVGTVTTADGRVVTSGRQDVVTGRTGFTPQPPAEGKAFVSCSAPQVAVGSHVGPLLGAVAGPALAVSGATGAVEWNLYDRTAGGFLDVDSSASAGPIGVSLHAAHEYVLGVRSDPDGSGHCAPGASLVVFLTATGGLFHATVDLTTRQIDSTGADVRSLAAACLESCDLVAGACP